MLTLGVTWDFARPRQPFWLTSSNLLQSLKGREKWEFSNCVVINATDDALVPLGARASPGTAMKSFVSRLQIYWTSTLRVSRYVSQTGTQGHRPGESRVAWQSVEWLPGGTVMASNWKLTEAFLHCPQVLVVTYYLVFGCPWKGRLNVNEIVKLRQWNLKSYLYVRTTGHNKGRTIGNWCALYIKNLQHKNFQAMMIYGIHSDISILITHRCDK